MGKILDIYTTIRDRIDTAMLSGGDLDHFTEHIKGREDLITRQVNTPFIVTTFQATAEIKSDIRQRVFETMTNVRLVHRKLNNDQDATDVYDNSTDSKGIIRDFEKLLNILFPSNGDALNSKANTEPSYTCIWTEMEDEIAVDIEIVAPTVEFEPGDI